MAASISFISTAMMLNLVSSRCQGPQTSISSSMEDIATTTTPSPQSICEDEDYFKMTLKEQYTASFQIIKDAEDADDFEASGVTYDESRDVFWVVFDTLDAIGKIKSDLSRSSDNLLVYPLDGVGVNSNYFNGQDSGFEGIARDEETDTFYILSESMEFKDNFDQIVDHPIIRVATYNEQNTYIVNKICAIDFEAATDNKGFEELSLIKIDGRKYFVGLCEGNYCSSSDEGKDSGNGRVVLIEFEPEHFTGDGGGKYQYLMDIGITCLYKSIETFELPSYIDFIDYSGQQFRPRDDGNGNLFDVAIVSQESSSLWVGKVEWSVENGPDFSVNKKDGKLLEFPKGHNCETIFCNVEGVVFINNRQFVMVSDRAKRGGDQSWVCGEKDQSIHIFKMP